MRLHGAPDFCYISLLHLIKFSATEKRHIQLDTFQFCKAICADALVFVKCDAVNLGAEYARRLVFLQNNASLVCKDLQCITYVDIHTLTNFSRQDDSTKFVYFSYHSGRFHKFILFSWCFVFLRHRLTALDFFRLIYYIPILFFCQPFLKFFVFFGKYWRFYAR